MDESKLHAADFTIERIGKSEITVKPPLCGLTFVPEDSHIVFPAHESQISIYQNRGEALPMLELAGPREHIFHDPVKTVVGVVTCGGLCPGINTIIRSLVITSCNYYGVNTVYGFRYGFAGLNPELKNTPILLTPDLVDTIHEQGGTILSSSRGPQDPEVMANYLVSLGVNILYVVGGDGSIRGALDLANTLKKRKLQISVICIPKTIDNDIALIERSFGFETAVQEACKAVTSAHIEAKGFQNGVGIVKLMGREAGFIAATVALANPVANFCFIPEVPFTMDGPEGLLTQLQRRLQRKDHAVIILAEGAGQDLLQGDGADFDASGNVVLKDIGVFVSKKIKDYFKQNKKNVNVKYIDPSYMIRSVPAGWDDNVFCLMLAQNAVHAGMSGRTAMVVGYRNDHYVHLPMSLVTRERKTVDPKGRLWATVLETTGQPAEMV